MASRVKINIMPSERSSSRIGEPFNPWRGACGFYAPDVVSRLGPMVILGTRRKLSHAHKQLYTLLVRRWGREGPCYPSYESLAIDLGASLRSAKMLVEDLEAFGLIRHPLRRGRERGGRHLKNEYVFLWHAIFEVQNPSVMKCKDGVFEVQEPASLKCKNQPALYSEETHTSETRPASEPAGQQFADELKRLVNGYRHPAGRWMDGCSRVGLRDGPLLDAVVEVARDHGLAPADVAELWRRKAASIAKRAARADDPDNYFRAAMLAELGGVTPAKSNPPAPAQAPIGAGNQVDVEEGVAAWERPPAAAAPAQQRDFVDAVDQDATDQAQQLASPPAPPPCEHCDGFGVRKLAADPDLCAWCDCTRGLERRELEPGFVDKVNTAVLKLRGMSKSGTVADAVGPPPLRRGPRPVREFVHAAAAGAAR